MISISIPSAPGFGIPGKADVRADNSIFFGRALASHQPMRNTKALAVATNGMNR